MEGGGGDDPPPQISVLKELRIRNELIMIEIYVYLTTVELPTQVGQLASFSKDCGAIEPDIYELLLYRHTHTQITKLLLYRYTSGFAPSL